MQTCRSAGLLGSELFNYPELPCEESSPPEAMRSRDMSLQEGHWSLDMEAVVLGNSEDILSEWR